MSKIVSKGRNTWEDGSMMTYTISDEGVLTISGVLKAGYCADIRSKAPFHHVAIEEGITEYYGIFSPMNDIEEITLPTSLTTIGKGAFYECKKLRRINFPEGLKHIGEDAFRDCESLESVNLPISLTTIGKFAFCGCKELKKVKIPGGVHRIEEKAFWCCSNLKEVQIAKGVESIGESAFACCKSLESVKIPKSVTYIRDCAFDDCVSLKEVLLPNDAIRLGYKAFGEDECHTIEEGNNTFEFSLSHVKTNRVKVSFTSGSYIEGDVLIPEKIEYKGNSYIISVIEENAFSENNKLTSVTLPDSIEEIDDYAFQECKNLISFKSGRSLRSMGVQCFYGCTKLANVDLGLSLEHIGMDAFHYCEKLEHLELPETLQTLGCDALRITKVFREIKGVLYLGKVLCGYKDYFPEHAYLEVRDGITVIAERAFTGVSHLEGVVFSDSVKYIGYCAFDECEDLKYIRLPKSLVSIGYDAFNYTSLTRVDAPWRKPVALDCAPFPKSAVIYIPKGSAEAYSQAKYWNEYKLVER